MSENTRLDPSAVPRRLDGYAIKNLPCCPDKFRLTAEADRRTVMTLNRTSALVWELCNGEWSVADMLETLKGSFPDAAEQIEQDVHQVLGSFREAEVIELVA